MDINNIPRNRLYNNLAFLRPLTWLRMLKETGFTAEIRSFKPSSMEKLYELLVMGYEGKETNIINQPAIRQGYFIRNKN